MANLYNSQLDAFDLYHKTREPSSTLLSGPALPALGHALAGATGAAISNVLTYPLDLIITRLQIQRHLRKDSTVAHNEEYTSIRDAAEKIYTREGGTKGFYVGLLQDTSKTIADSFLFFLAYNFLRQSRLRSQKRSSSHLPALEELGVGFLAGSFAKALTTPLANIVTRKQASSMLAARNPDSSPRGEQSVRAIAAKIRSEKGLLGFWSGYSASLVLTLNPSLTFFFYETLQRLLLPRPQRTNPPPSATFLLAAISKAMASTITYPFSLAKSRAQVSLNFEDDNDNEVRDTIEKASDGTTAGTPRARKAARRTVFSTILHIARKDGVGALYEGLEGEVLKGFFSHGITMIVKQAVHKVIIQLYFMMLKALKRFPAPTEVVDATKVQADSAMVVVRTVVVEVKEGGQRLVQQGSEKAYDAAKGGVSAAKGAGSAVQDGVRDTSNKATVRAGELYGTARKAATSTAGKASDIAGAGYHTAREAGTSVAGKASDIADATSQKSLEAGGNAVDSIGKITKPVAEVVGRKVEETGKAIRPSDGDSK